MRTPYTHSASPNEAESNALEKAIDSASLFLFDICKSASVCKQKTVRTGSSARNGQTLTYKMNQRRILSDSPLSVGESPTFWRKCLGPKENRSLHLYRQLFFKNASYFRDCLQFVYKLIGKKGFPFFVITICNGIVKRRHYLIDAFRNIVNRITSGANLYDIH